MQQRRKARGMDVLVLLSFLFSTQLQNTCADGLEAQGACSHEKRIRGNQQLLGHQAVVAPFRRMTSLAPVASTLDSRLSLACDYEWGCRTSPVNKKYCSHHASFPRSPFSNVGLESLSGHRAGIFFLLANAWVAFNIGLGGGGGGSALTASVETILFF